MEKLVGKWKMSQELGPGGREGFITGSRDSVGGTVGEELAELVKSKGEAKRA